MNLWIVCKVFVSLGINLDEMSPPQMYGTQFSVCYSLELGKKTLNFCWHDQTQKKAQYQQYQR